MPFPDDPLAFDYEMYVGDWVTITSEVSDSDQVTIARGWQDEAGGFSTAPSNARLRLYNDNGQFSPANPEGPYFELLDVNTPLRIALRRGVDTFGRVVANGWGTNEWNQAWTTPKGSGGVVAAANYAVNGSAATVSVPIAGGFRWAQLVGPVLRTVEVVAQSSIPTGTPTGAPIWPLSILLRGVSDTDWVYAGASITTAGAIRIGIHHYDGTVIAANATIAGLTHSAGQVLVVRAQAEGHTFRAKVWVSGTPEPYDWQVSGHFTRNYAPGFVGVMHLVEVGNTNAMPIVATIDNVIVRIPRFTGEMSDLRVRWDSSEETMTTQVVAQGIRRRLGQGASPLLSPARRRISHILTTSVGNPHIKHWWPLEDDSEVQQIEEATGTAVEPVTVNTPGGISWGGHTNPPGAPRAVTVSQNSLIFINPAPGVVSTAWAVAVAMQCDLNKAGILHVDASTGGSNSWNFRLIVGADGVAYVQRTVTGIGGIQDLIISRTVRAGGWQLNEWHHYILAFRQSGGNLVTELWIDGALTDTHTSVGVSVQALRLIQPTTEGSYAGPISFSHLVLLAGASSTWHADTVDAISDAALGHRGERAGRRLERVLAEEGLGFDYTGNLDDTEVMGPQPTSTLLAILDECAAVDQGCLTDPRGALGFLYRTRTSVYHQTVTLTLDYASEHLDPPLEPARDDAGLRNDIRVGRTGGAPPYRAQLLTGRKSVLAPHQGGAGRYDEGYTLNVYLDDQCVGIAHWKLAKGTQEGTRYPQITIELATEQFIAAGLTDGALNMDILDLLALVNMPKRHDPRSARLLAGGYVETLRNVVHRLSLVCQPEGVFRVGVVSATDTKVDSANSVITGGPYAPGVTSLSVATSAPSHPWITGAVSIDLDIAGEQVAVTNIAGATSPQTFTVVRSQNNVSKTQVNGARVRLARPVKVGLRR
jgi:hypothetical protein